MQQEYNSLSEYWQKFSNNETQKKEIEIKRWLIGLTTKGEALPSQSSLPKNTTITIVQNDTSSTTQTSANATANNLSLSETKASTNGNLSSTSTKLTKLATLASFLRSNGGTLSIMPAQSQTGSEVAPTKTVVPMAAIVTKPNYKPQTVTVSKTNSGLPPTPTAIKTSSLISYASHNSKAYITIAYSPILSSQSATHTVNSKPINGNLAFRRT